MSHPLPTLSAFVSAIVSIAATLPAEDSRWPDDCDVAWDSPSEDWHGSMPLGNGDIGLNLWAEADGEVAFFISKTDAWDENARLLKVGGVRLRLDPNPFAKGRPFRQTLRLRDATVEIRSGEGVSATVVRAWVDANHPVVHVAVESSGPVAVVATSEVWRTERREIADLQVSDILTGKPAGRPERAVAEPDVLLANQTGRIGWYHHNPRSLGPDLLAEIQGLRGYAQADPLLHRTFGAVVAARGGERVDDRTLRCPAATSHLVSVFVLTRHPSTPEAWLASLEETIRGVEATTAEARREAHERWWSEFWSRSWIRATAASSAVPSPVVPATRLPVRIGEDQAGGNRLSGDLGRVSILGRAVSEDEMARLAGKGPEDAAAPVGDVLVSGRSPPRGSIAGSEAWDFSKGLTIEAWVRPTRLPGGGARIVDRITPGGSDGFLLDTCPGNSVRVICGDAVLARAGAAPEGTWTHLAAVADPATGLLRLFVGGKRVAEQALGAVRDPASLVSRMAALQRFVNACAGRGAYPIKFNGSIFTVPAPGGSDPDYRRWGPGYWWQNTRLPYVGMCASGDFDLMEPLFRMYVDDLLGLCKHRTRLYCGHEGAFYPECIMFWGPVFSETYGWTPFEERTDKLQESGWHKWEWVGGLELCGLLLDRWEYTLDDRFLREKALPFCREILTFFDRHYPTDERGKLVMHPSQALETWWECTNPMPELAGLIAVTERLVALPAGVGPDADRELWTSLRAKLPPLPVREVDGKKALAPAEKFARKQNIENPELYAVFPFRLVAVGRPDLELGIEALRHRWDRGHAGWRQDDIFMAWLGLSDEAAAAVAARARSHDPSARFPAFWGPNYDWTPDQDHGGVLVKAFQAMLLQTDGRRILLLPAWPRSWDVRFRLHAPYRTVVEGEYRDGKLRSLAVTPPERRGDVEVLH